MTTRKVLFINHNCYFDDSNGAAVASRNQMESLARHGFAVEALTGFVLELADEARAAAWFASRGFGPPGMSGIWPEKPHEIRSDIPAHWRRTVNNVEVTIHSGPTHRPHWPDAAEQVEFLWLYEEIAARSRIDIAVGYGGSEMIAEVFARVRARGGVAVFALHNFAYLDCSVFAHVDALTAPSQYAAAHYQQLLGLECTVLPNLVDLDRVRCQRAGGPGYVTFVNPSAEKGVVVFARIADELGRRRTDIRFLVVEGRGTEATVAACGLDLRQHRTVYFINHPPDPRRFWAETRICLMPSVWEESQGLVAIEAMSNGIPVVASDRGALPETLGQSGVVLSLPDRLTPSASILPTPDEVAPWVEAIIRLWDDTIWYADQQARARAEARRWDAELVEPRHNTFFAGLRSMS